MIKYRITIKSLTGNTLYFRNVEEWRVEEGFLTFKDQKTGQTKRFSHSNAEIEEEKETREAE